MADPFLCDRQTFFKVRDKLENITIEDLMVPIDEYATVREDASIYEAVKALEKAQEDLDHDRYAYLHRAILVLDKNDRVIGKISQLDVLRALEPKYGNMGDTKMISHAGFSRDFINSMMDYFALCERPFSEMCDRASNMKAIKFMYTLTEGEYIDVEMSLCEAIHLFIMGHHQSLLVARNDKIIGILRLTDVFKEVFQMMESRRKNK